MMNSRFTRFLFFVFIFFPHFGFSQGEWNNWYFGYHAAMTFNSGVPVALTNSAMAAYHSSISVSDSSGNLLFYSEGFKVWNRNNYLMPDGSGLMGCGNSEQPVFAFLKPGEDSVYYLFTVGDNFPNACPYGLRYSLVDMRLDGGLGDIVPGYKNIPLPMGDSACIYLTAIRHQNNHDIWVVTRRHGYTKDNYLSYLVTLSGINAPVINSSSVFGFAINGGQMKISQDGTKLFCPFNDTICEYCNFNCSNGSVTPLFRFNTSTADSYYGAEFSADTKFLYLTTQLGNWPTSKKVYQFNARAPDSLTFVQSRIIIGSGSSLDLELGPDWKIYCVTSNIFHDSLNVIENPSGQGQSCNFLHNIIYLDGNQGSSLPQFLQKYFAYIYHSNHCQEQPVDFIGSVWPPSDSVHWDFGDPVSGALNFSTISNPSHVYTNVGVYTVNFFVKHIDNRTDNAWLLVEIDTVPHFSLGPDRSICIGDSVTFTAGSYSGCSYLWTNLLTGLPVGTGQTFTTGQAGIYQVVVTNTFGCDGRDTVQLITNQQPVVTNNPLSKTICSGESTNIALTSNELGANFYWTTTLTSGNINGFSADSGLIINQILTNNGSFAGIVTYHITPKVGSCAGTAVDFPVTVDVGDSVKVSISASTNNVCAGTAVTFTATPTNGGSSPLYQWKVNGNNVGTNSPGYIYNPASGDLVSCILTSSITVCISNNPATSNTIQMVVNPLNPVSITITISQNPVCAGTTVVFTANPVNGGTTPSFQWKVNNTNVGSNSPVYSYIPANGDLVSCTLTSSELCTSNNPASSIQYPVSVNTNPPVSITITASNNPVCSGIPVNFTATPVNGGSTPVYQWQVNGGNAGSNSSLYQYTPLNGDLVNCMLTSNLNCTTGNPATSNTITMNVSVSPVVTFTHCNDSITTINAQPFRLKGGIPLGGTYSGPGVTNGIFYPAIAGVGTHQINYTYTNAALCTVTDHRSLITINPVPFTCGNPVTDIRDNKIYPTVQIGSQCWIAEDLNYGTEIPADLAQRDNCLPEKYHNPASGIQHPASVYQWNELMQYDETVSNQGLCPPGWHIPTEADWNALFANYINNGFAGSPLKYSGFSGFNALLTGASHMNKSWDFQGFATYFWSSTAHGTNKARAHGMNDMDPSVSLYPAFRSNAFSVRCLKD